MTAAYEDRDRRLRAMIEAARNTVRNAETALSDLEGELQLLQLEEVGKYHKLDPDHEYVVGDWDCPESPIKVCVYDSDGDLAHDECIVCGDPEERK